MLHPIDKSQIRGGWCIGTSNGNLIDLNNLSDSDIDFDSIMQALAMQCRYGGHVQYHYSVAQHSLYVEGMVARDIGAICRASFAGLIHDFSEGLMQDLVRGVKVGILEETEKYRNLEYEVQSRIARVAGLEDYDDYHDIVKKWDNRVLKEEILAVGKPGPEWLEILNAMPGAPISIQKMTPEDAKDELKCRFDYYQALLKAGRI